LRAHDDFRGFPDSIRAAPSRARHVGRGGEGRAMGWQGRPLTHPAEKPSHSVAVIRIANARSEKEREEDTAALPRFGDQSEHTDHDERYAYDRSDDGEREDDPGKDREEAESDEDRAP
jgi:hypothetical protein